MWLGLNELRSFRPVLPQPCLKFQWVCPVFGHYQEVKISIHFYYFWQEIHNLYYTNYKLIKCVAFSLAPGAYSGSGALRGGGSSLTLSFFWVPRWCLPAPEWRRREQEVSCGVHSDVKVSDFLAYGHAGGASRSTVHWADISLLGLFTDISHTCVSDRSSWAPTSCHDHFLFLRFHEIKSTGVLCLKVTS